jgi:hypothetical protein
MSHNQRLYWLKTMGFTPEDWGADIESIGRSVLVKGLRHGVQEEFWLAANDGRALIHNESSKAKTWQELQAWIQERPEVKKPLAAQRNLFGDE